MCKIKIKKSRLNVERNPRQYLTIFDLKYTPNNIDSFNQFAIAQNTHKRYCYGKLQQTKNEISEPSSILLRACENTRSVTKPVIQISLSRLIWIKTEKVSLRLTGVELELQMILRKVSVSIFNRLLRISINSYSPIYQKQKP